MRRILGRIFLAGLAFAAVSFFAAPVVAFFAIRSAAEASDVQGLSRLIDFDEVRRSLRPQLQPDPQVMVPPPSFLDDPIGAVRRQFEVATVPRGPDPDLYLTPRAIQGLTRGEGRRASVATGPVQDGAGLPGLVYWGFQRARLAVSGPDGARTMFTFERRGLYQWVLVHVGLPDGATPVPNSAGAGR